MINPLVTTNFDTYRTWHAAEVSYDLHWER